MKNIRTIHEDDKIFALIPLEEYERLLEQADQASDEALFDLACAREQEAFPLTLFDSIAAGKSAVRAFREYRGMTVRALAAAAGISEGYLSQIESGHRIGTAKVLKSLARALHGEMDVLVLEGDD